MASLLASRPSLVLIIVFAGLASAQQHCYYAPGSQFQVDGLVPCQEESEYSACCLQGDTCLAGNACYNYDADTVYQYGCTDLTYQHDSCPFKCGWSPDHSPWVALEYCDSGGVDDVWVCHSPETCGCQWRSTYGILRLPGRTCEDMGHLARVGVYGPTSLLPYVALPSEQGGSTGYFSTVTVSGTVTVSPTTAKSGYTPDPIPTPITYAAPPPRSIVTLFEGAASPGSGTAILVTGASSGLQPPIPTDPVLEKTSSFPASFLAGITTGGGVTPTGGSGGGSSSTGSGGSSANSTGAGSGGSGNNDGSSSNDNNGGGGGLSTGSKVGIGVGIAGAACLIAAIALVWWVLKRRKQPSDGARPQDPDYAQGYHEKTHDSYASEAPATYYDAERRGSPSPGVYEAPYHTPQEEEAVKKRLSPLGPQELAGSPVAEMESGSNTPSRSPRMQQY